MPILRAGTIAATFANFSTNVDPPLSAHAFCAWGHNEDEVDPDDEEINARAEAELKLRFKEMAEKNPAVKFIEK